MYTVGELRRDIANIPSDTRIDFVVRKDGGILQDSTQLENDDISWLPAIEVLEITIILED